MTSEWIAHEAVVFQYADGRRVHGLIAVGPAVQTEAEARCIVALDGIDSKTTTVCGASTLQALLLGLHYLGYRLHSFMSKGGVVLDPVDESNLEIEAYFGPLLRPAPDTKQPVVDD